MRLYILRHGDAERLAATDSQRQLTPVGENEVKAVTQRNRNALATVHTIFASPYDRAQQTAALVNQAFPTIPLQTLDILTPNHRPIDVVKFLCKQPSNSSLLLVSHQPLVSELIGDLCNIPPISVGMHTAALASIDLDPVASGMGTLQFID